MEKKFHSGDRVQVKPFLTAGETYGGRYFNKSMSEFCGQIVTLIECYDTTEEEYLVEEDGALWHWTPEMFVLDECATAKQPFVGHAEKNPKKWSRFMKQGLRARYIIMIAAAFVALLLIFSSLSVVTAGHTGVLVTLGKVRDGVLQEGLHLKAPFVQRIVKVDNRIQKLEVNTEAFSRDLQSVETVLAVNYRVDPTKSDAIYKNVGDHYEEVLIVPAVNEVLKAITAKYTAEESVANRNVVSEGLISGLNTKLSAAGLYITDVNIINFDFSDAFIKAIEEKQVAQQKLLKAETDRKTAVTNAKAEAEALKINAEAQAEANKKLAASLSDRVIENKRIEKWNGAMPKTVVGDEGNILMQIGQ